MSNCITKPLFIKAQLEICYKCEWASKKKLWCCKHGGYLQEAGKIIQPDKKVKYPSLPKMAGNFAKSASKHALSGFKNRSKVEQQRVMAICKVCDFFVVDTKLGPRCKKCGCCTNVKSKWATENCPIGKW